MEKFERKLTDEQFREAVADARTLVEGMATGELTENQISLIKKELAQLTLDDVDAWRKPLQEWLVFSACQHAVIEHPSEFHPHDVRDAFSVTCLSVPGSQWDNLYESWSSSMT